MPTLASGRSLALQAVADSYSLRITTCTAVRQPRDRLVEAGAFDK
jgi:hypothetical protein